jgi:type VI secretion system protein ImpM
LSGDDNLLGWYGKLPCLGDFISKRLPESFVKPWDAWLQAGMVEGKAVFAGDWEEHFLTFPMWRFLLDRHVIDDSHWVGLVFPSADRVGRLFPFTVAFRLPENASNAFNIKHLDQVLDCIEDLVHEVLENDSLEDFEFGLTQIQHTKPTLPAQQASLFDLEQAQSAIPITEATGLDDLLSTLAVRELFSRKVSRALWWVPHKGHENGIVRTSPAGLSSAHFIELVRGIN